MPGYGTLQVDTLGMQRLLGLLAQRRQQHGGVAEVGDQNLWQRASLGMAAVASTPSHVKDVLDEVERFVWSFPEIEVVEATRDWMELDK